MILTAQIRLQHQKTNQEIQEQRIKNEIARLELEEKKDSYKTRTLAEKLEIQFTANGTAIENGRNTGEETDGPVAHSEKAKQMLVKLVEKRDMGNIHLKKALK